MADKTVKTGTLGVLLGAIVAVVLVVFIMAGGSKTTVEGDKDLPPVADPAKPVQTTR